MLNADLTPEIAATGVEVQGSQATCTVICTVIWVYGLGEFRKFGQRVQIFGVGLRVLQVC